MDENDNIIKKFNNFFYSMTSPNNGKVLVVSKSIERTRVNICLLKFFLHEMKMKGIFITIDRPHQYTASLLTMHGISQEKLIYIDAVSRISGETESNVSNVKFINGPYELDFLAEISSMSYAAGAINRDRINFEDIDFILIDDITALTKYQDDDGVKKMIEAYIESMEQLKKVTAPIVLDVNQNKFIYDILIGKCSRVLLVNLSKSIIKEITETKAEENKDNFMERMIAGIESPTSSGGY